MPQTIGLLPLYEKIFFYRPKDLLIETVFFLNSAEIYFLLSFTPVLSYLSPHPVTLLLFSLFL